MCSHRSKITQTIDLRSGFADRCTDGDALETSSNDTKRKTLITSGEKRLGLWEGSVKSFNHIHF